MKKSEILEVLENVLSYEVIVCGDKTKFLRVIVEQLGWSEIEYIIERVLYIEPNDDKSIVIEFDSKVIID